MLRDNPKFSNLSHKDTLVHLRIPFSFYLLPVFCFGISLANPVHIFDTALLFLALHFFIYPASNAYNSFMDKDTSSIGGIKAPPPVTKNLFYASILFDAVGLLICLLANLCVALLAVVYVVFSKMYSWHGIRLKKYSYAAWLTVACIQGGFTFLMANMTAENQFSAQWFTSQNLWAMLIATILIGGSYPLTQIYQHRQDRQSGDKTISLKLGIKGTFIFSGVSFFIASLLLFFFFQRMQKPWYFILFLVCLLPVVIYFSLWFYKSLRHAAAASFENTMRMNQISSLCMVVYFVILFLLQWPRTQII